MSREITWRWRWDLNPRKTCAFTRFRGLRTTVHQRPSASVTCADTIRAATGERWRTGVNETKTETRRGLLVPWRPEPVDGLDRCGAQSSQAVAATCAACDPKSRRRGPNGRVSPRWHLAVRLAVFIPLQAELLEPHGRDESFDALLAAPDGWHHEYRTDRNLVHDGPYRSLAGEEWVGRRSLESSG
jgi:hypothetical protein